MPWPWLVEPMHALLLDFQHHRRRPRWLGIVLLAGGISVASYLTVTFVNILTTVDVLESKRALLEHQLNHAASTSRLSAADAHQLRAEINDARDVLVQLSLPWNKLFHDIGTAQQDQVALLSIVPDAPRRTIKITGEAKDLIAVVDYIRRLQKAHSLGSIYLQNHHVELRAVEKPVRFTILASWEVTR